MLSYDHKDIAPEPTFSVTINGVRSVVSNTRELRELLTRYNIEMIIYNEKVEEGYYGEVQSQPK